MKKKFLFILTLALLLTFGSAPAAWAGGEEGVKTYDELVDKIDKLGQPGSSVYIAVNPADDFGWPDTATLTLPKNIGLRLTEAWSIPQGITVAFANGSAGIRCPELTLNCEIQMNYSSQDSILRDCSKVIIGENGCEITVANSVYGGSLRISPDQEFQVMGTLEASSIRLGGTLTGSGKVNASVNVQGGYGGGPDQGIISGTLTLNKGIRVGQTGTNTYDDILTIPAGSHIKLQGTQDYFAGLSIYSGTVNLQGTLEAENDPQSPNFNCVCFNRKDGKMNIAEGGQLILNSHCGIDYGQDVIPYSFRLTEENKEQVPMMVHGQGKIVCQVKEQNDIEDWYMLSNRIDDVVKNAETPDKLTIANLFIDFHNITIEHNWLSGSLITDITLNVSKITLLTGGDIQLTANVAGTGAADKTVTWQSTNPEVATVDSNGMVTAIAPGQASIIALAGDIKRECLVRVADKDNVYKISFDTDGGTLAGVNNPDYVTRGENYKLPNASKSGYTLRHWAIGSRNSSITLQANDVYKFTADTTLYAIWQGNASSESGSDGGDSGDSGDSGDGGTTTSSKPGSSNNTGTGTTSGNTLTITGSNISSVFGDVQNNAWYSEAIAYAYNQGMMNGTEKGFEPNATTTRAMLVTMLYRLEGQPAAGSASFADITGGQWYSQAVAWSAANGVVNGYENGKFGPNDAITREQLAVILYRYAQLQGLEVSAQGSLNSFADSNQVASWATEAMQWAVGAGIINGDNGALKPAGNATRAEVATMLMRFNEQIAK